jgi:transcriptional regulator with XRE-family HTH domain
MAPLRPRERAALRQAVIDQLHAEGRRTRDEALAARLRGAPPILYSFARKLRRLRQERGPTSAAQRGHRTGSALAQKAGITSAFLSQLERGQREPSLPTLAKLAEVLAVPIGDLLAPVEPPPPPPTPPTPTRHRAPRRKPKPARSRKRSR